jgi:hypothetical protein
MTAIDSNILDILRRGRSEDNRFYLPPTPLDRKTYQAVNDVLAALGGAWKGGKVRAHVFDAGTDAAALIASVCEAGEKPRSAQQEYAAFFTPPDIAGRLVAHVRFESGMRILEPSAGQGALIDMLLSAASDLMIDAVELQPKNVAVLREKYGAHPSVRGIVEGDILRTRLDYAAYDCIVCNPPFTAVGDSLAWVTHLRYYIDALLKPGGRIVGIAPNSLRFRQVGVIAKLRADIEAHGYIEDLPSGARGRGR